MLAIIGNFWLYTIPKKSCFKHFKKLSLPPRKRDRTVTTTIIIQKNIIIFIEGAQLAKAVLSGALMH